MSHRLRTWIAISLGFFFMIGTWFLIGTPYEENMIMGLILAFIFFTIGIGLDVQPPDSQKGVWDDYDRD